jgi:hypothetical protein
MMGQPENDGPALWVAGCRLLGTFAGERVGDKAAGAEPPEPEPEPEPPSSSSSDEDWEQALQGQELEGELLEQERLLQGEEQEWEREQEREREREQQEEPGPEREQDTERLLAVGTRATIVGLVAQPHLNGRRGTVEGWSPSRQRYLLRVGGRDRAVGVRPGNIILN